jgi:membrane protein DedA with SNARE-associated domain
MSEMSPLARILMGILRSGTLGAAALLVLFAGIFLWQNITPDGTLDLDRQDWGFLGVLVALFLLAFYLIRAFKKELNNQGGK